MHEIVMLEKIPNAKGRDKIWFLKGTNFTS